MAGNRKIQGDGAKPGNVRQGGEVRGGGVSTKGSEIRNESSQAWGIKPRTYVFNKR